MANQEFDLKDMERRMNGALNVLRTEFAGLRTGRASASILEPIVVDAYGSPTPLSQVATISVPEARMLSVQVWDKNVAAAVERAIREAELGLNPISEGAVLRIPIPPLNEERRNELIKVAHKYAEQSRVAIRHVRRSGMDTLKRLEKDGDIGQDESRVHSEKLQKLTDTLIEQVDEILAQKEQDIAHV